jgi:hypothetical protein
MKTERITRFLAFLIIMAAVLTFSSCDDKEETYDNVPAELQTTWSFEDDSSISFSVTTWTYTKSLGNFFTVSNLKVTPTSNNYSNKDKYPSGYEITGKIISSNGSYKSTHPVGKFILYQFFLTPDKKGISVWYNPNQ